MWPSSVATPPTCRGNMLCHACRLAGGPGALPGAALWSLWCVTGPEWSRGCILGFVPGVLGFWGQGERAASDQLALTSVLPSRGVLSVPLVACCQVQHGGGGLKHIHRHRFLTHQIYSYRSAFNTSGKLWLSCLTCERLPGWREGRFC